MNLFIAGVNGYIGSHLYSQLEKHVSVTSIDYSQGSIENNFTKLDLTDIVQVNRFAENCTHFDILIFLVGLAHVKGKGKDLPKFKKVNYQTLVNLLSALRSNNKIPDKIIFSSTISVYGEKYYQSVYGEDSVKKPFSPYAVTKLEAEQYLLDKYADKSWILRFAPVYSSDFLLNINRRSQMGGWFYRVGKGYKKLSLCNMENIGAVVQAIIKDQVPPGVYNISDPIDYSYNDILNNQHAARVLPIPRFIVQTAYTYSKITGNIFLKENAVKLLTDNIYPSDKIRFHVNYFSTLN